MNKTKVAYKTTIVNFIIDCYVELDNNVVSAQGCLPETELNQEISTLKYMKNLIRTITAESDEEINERIKEGRERLNQFEENEEDEGFLVCKICGYKQYDEETIKYYKKKFKNRNKELHDIGYMCGACKDNYEED